MISLESGPDVLLVLILTILIQISKNHRLRPGRSRFWFRLRSNRPSSRPPGPATMLTYDPIPAPAPDLAFQGPDPGSAVFDVYTTASTGPPESAESAPAPGPRSRSRHRPRPRPRPRHRLRPWPRPWPQHRPRPQPLAFRAPGPGCYHRPLGLALGSGPGGPRGRCRPAPRWPLKFSVAPAPPRA